jgi:hypothetical protein
LVSRRRRSEGRSKVLISACGCVLSRKACGEVRLKSLKGERRVDLASPIGWFALHLSEDLQDM